VTTQLWYVLPAAAGAAVAFTCAGLLPLPPLARAGISILAGIVCSWLLLYIINRLLATKNTPATL
jgi:purine-cytosine permease-like protein